MASRVSPEAESVQLIAYGRSRRQDYARAGVWEAANDGVEGETVRKA